jgi:undecaprenyl-diphosphatase
MALFRIRPTRADIEIAERISDRTCPEVEQIAKILTWGADEHVICALAAGLVALLQASRRAGSYRQQPYPAHDGRGYAAAAFPEVDLRSETPRPSDGPRAPYGVPFSGKPLDAFPSGHAIHVGALASAATVLPPAKRNLAWSIGAGLVLTRIVLLAHRTSDVIAGLAIGAAVERLLRHWTGFGLSHRE